MAATSPRGGSGLLGGLGGLRLGVCLGGGSRLCGRGLLGCWSLLDGRRLDGGLRCGGLRGGSLELGGGSGGGR